MIDERTRIWKYVLDQPDSEGRTYLEIPSVGSEIISAGFQGDDIVVWVRIQVERVGLINERRRLICVNTGVEVLMPRYSDLIATITHPTHGTVWHLFDADA